MVLPLDPMEVRIHELQPGLDLAGAKVVGGFPSVGLVSTIAANYLIDMLKLKQIGFMDNPNFPTLSVVHGGEPLSPVRIYGGDRSGENKGSREKIIVFVSEFQPSPQLMRPIAETLLAWAKKKKADYVISPEGLVLEGEASQDDKVEIFGIGSSERINKVLKTHDVAPFREGIITGVSGILLTIGRREGFDVMSILAEAHPNYPDARSAAKVIEVVAKLMGMRIPVKPLIQEAEGFETQIRMIHKQAGIKGKESTPNMYG